MSKPHTEFDWAIYAYATFAGLAVLIPIPLIDWIFEEFFRRRTPRAIVRYRDRDVSPVVIDKLNKGNGSWLTTCLMLPVKATFGLIKRISRKLLYFLTIKEAIDKLTYYWQRAFLIDYMLLVGHLDNEETVEVAREAMEQVLDTTASPLRQLAKQVIAGTHHIFRSLRKARRGKEDEMIQQKKSQMIRGWVDFEPYLTTLAARYDRVYEEIKARPSPLVE